MRDDNDREHRVPRAGADAGPGSARITQFSLNRGEAAVITIPLPPGDHPLLTDAETEVFSLLKEGRGNRGIAEQRRTSVRTAEKQVRQVFRKLGVCSRTELLREYA